MTVFRQTGFIDQRTQFQIGNQGGIESPLSILQQLADVKVRRSLLNEFQRDER